MECPLRVIKVSRCDDNVFVECSNTIKQFSLINLLHFKIFCRVFLKKGSVWPCQSVLMSIWSDVKTKWQCHTMWKLLIIYNCLQQILNWSTMRYHKDNKVGYHESFHMHISGERVFDYFATVHFVEISTLPPSNWWIFLVWPWWWFLWFESILSLLIKNN